MSQRIQQIGLVTWAALGFVSTAIYMGGIADQLIVTSSGFKFCPLFMDRENYPSHAFCGDSINFGYFLLLMIGSVTGTKGFYTYKNWEMGKWVQLVFSIVLGLTTVVGIIMSTALYFGLSATCNYLTRGGNWSCTDAFQNGFSLHGSKHSKNYVTIQASLYCGYIVAFLFFVLTCIEARTFQNLKHTKPKPKPTVPSMAQAPTQV
jgi:hypothetical protein